MPLSRTAAWRRIGSNAAANISSGGMVAVSQLGMTAIAARSFAADTFALWTVLISMAALSPLFGANLSAIVTRSLVSVEQGGEAARTAILQAAQRLAHQLSGVALVSICALVLAIRPYSPPLQHSALPSVMLAGALLVVAQLWQVSLLPAMGWHYAREQAWWVAGTTGFVRLSTLGAMLLAWLWAGGDATLTAALVCAVAWTAVAICWRMGFTPVAKGMPDPLLTGQHGAQIRQLAKAFAVWSLGSAAIQYGLPAVMSILAGARYNAFYLAYTLNLVALGIVGSVATALMAPVTRLVGAEDKPALKRAIFWGPVATAAVLAGMLVMLQVATPLVVRYLAPGVAAEGDVGWFIYLLGFQTLTRSLALVYSVILSAAGSPRQVAAPILIEIAMVLAMALPAGLHWGDTAFLAALGLAGLVAALSVAVLTVRIVNFQSAERIGILARFVGVQAVAAAFWAIAGHP